VIFLAASAGPRSEGGLAISDRIIAIDVLLQPDQTMVSIANALNARLRGNYPGGYALDATHAPHVTLLQRFIQAKDLDAVAAAVARVASAERATDLQLRATGPLRSEPFDAFTFKPAGVAIYQLGNFGTASRKLKELALNP